MTALAGAAFAAVVAAGVPGTTWAGATAAGATSASPGAGAASRLAQDVQVNSSGCPESIGVDFEGGHCVSWPVTFHVNTTSSASGCGQSLFMLMPLNAKID
jgi:hypothetical protein